MTQPIPETPAEEEDPLLPPRRLSVASAWLWIGALLALLLILAGVSRCQHTSPAIVQGDIPLPAEGQPKAPTTTATTQPTSQARLEPISPPELKHDTLTVQSGDNLIRLFERAGLPASLAHNIARLDKNSQSLNRLKPGDALHLTRNAQGQLRELSYDLDQRRMLVVKQDEQGALSSTVQPLPIKLKEKVVWAEIRSSLFQAGHDAGLSDATVMRMADIYAWDIDFARDLREGDWFRVLYQQIWREGKHIGDGPILATEFSNRGKRYTGVRYVDAQGNSDYYSPEGRSLRSTFIRTPVDFTRISSRFSLGRKHPILNRIRAHHGVDYAAPMGTPVKATANGKVIFKGRKGGYGNVLILDHGRGYSTVYAHLSRFARHIKKGARVKQGHTIAYVGMTGLATGPHLHYEFRIKGKHHDPLTVKLPKAKPIAQQHMADFINQTAPLLTRLQGDKKPAAAGQ